MDRKNGHQEDLKLKIFKNLHLVYLLQRFAYLLHRYHNTDTLGIDTQTDIKHDIHTIVELLPAWRNYVMQLNVCQLLHKKRSE